MPTLRSQVARTSTRGACATERTPTAHPPTCGRSGVQSFDIGGGNRLIGFGVSTWNRWSNASTTEFDIFVDVDPQNANGDDYIVVGVDNGAISTGTFNGFFDAFVFSTRSSGASSLTGSLGALTDGSTVFLPILSSQLCRAGEPCLSAANPRFTYHAIGFDLNEEEEDDMPLSASFNPWTPAIFTDNEFDFLTVDPGDPPPPTSPSTARSGTRLPLAA